MSIETMRVGAVNLSSHSRHLVRKMYVKTEIIIMHEQIAGIGFMKLWRRASRILLSYCSCFCHVCPWQKQIWAHTYMTSTIQMLLT